MGRTIRVNEAMAREDRGEYPSTLPTLTCCTRRDMSTPSQAWSHAVDVSTADTGAPLYGLCARAGEESSAYWRVARTDGMSLSCLLHLLQVAAVAAATAVAAAAVVVAAAMAAAASVVATTIVAVTAGMAVVVVVAAIAETAAVAATTTDCTIAVQ